MLQVETNGLFRLFRWKAGRRQRLIAPGEKIKKRRTDCSREDYGSENDGLLQGENKMERRTDFFREEQEGGKDVFVHEKNGMA